MQPHLVPNDHSVSQNSKTEHKLNDIMDEVLGQHSVGTHTPTTHRSSNKSNMKRQIIDHITDPQTVTIINDNNGARESLSNHRALPVNGSIPRNDSIPMPNMRGQLFGKTQKKSPSPSPSTFDGRSQNVQQIENIIIPRMHMAIGQSIRSPAFKEDDTKIDTTSGKSDTNLNKYVTDDEDITTYHEMNRKDSAFVHGLVTGQLTPTIGSKRSQDTGVTSFHPEQNMNNRLLVNDGMDSREIPIQLTPYDLDEDQKGNPTYSGIYPHDEKFPNHLTGVTTNGTNAGHTATTGGGGGGGITPTPNTHTHTTQNFEISNVTIKRMIESPMDLNDRSTDEYGNVHKGIHMEMQDSASYQSSILPLPDDVSGGTQLTAWTRRGKEHNEHESISFGNHESMVPILKDRYPAKHPTNSRAQSQISSIPSTTIQTGFSDSNGKHNGIDLIREISDTNTLDESKENSYRNKHMNINGVGNHNNNHDYLYDDDNKSTSTVMNKGHHRHNNFTAQDEAEDSLDIGSVMTNTTNNTLRNNNSIVPHSEYGSFRNIHSPSNVNGLHTSPSIIKDIINPSHGNHPQTFSKINAPFTSSTVPNFNNGHRSFQSDYTE